MTGLLAGSCRDRAEDGPQSDATPLTGPARRRSADDLASQGYEFAMSILGRLMGTAETAAKGAGRGRRTTARPTRGTARTTGLRGRSVNKSTGRTFGGGTGRGFGRAGRGRPAPAASGGLGQLVQGLLRRR
jgi:hypothetical protein